MPQFVSAVNFNPNALRADDIYVRVIPPPGFIQGVPSDIAAAVGTASWGPLNTPIHCGSPADFVRYFGNSGTAGLTDPYDGHTDVQMAFQQATSPASFSLIFVRVDDGTGAKATYTLVDTAGTPVNGLVLTALWTGVRGNDIRIKIDPGSQTNTWNLTLFPFDGGDPEFYPNIKGTASTNNTFWANAALAINQGINSVRPKSKLVVASSPSATAATPALGTFSMGSGTDGRGSVTATHLIGSDTAAPRTGMYALRGQAPQASILWLCGNSTTNTYATVQAFVNSEGMIGFLALAGGLSTADAITAKKGLGIDDPNICFVKDDVDWYDAQNGRVRRVPPTAIIAGRITCLGPEQSPSNKEVYAVVGTERTQPYSRAEVGDLSSNGILFINNQCPGGNYWGLRHGRNSSSDGVRSPVEYSRMTNFLGKSLAANLGRYVGQLQSIDFNDPTRLAAKNEVDSFLESLRRNRQIDSYLVVCDRTNNSADSIARHYLYMDVKVRYLSSIWYFVVSLQGGTTVVTLRDFQSEALAG